MKIANRRNSTQLMFDPSLFVQKQMAGSLFMETLNGNVTLFMHENAP